MKVGKKQESYFSTARDMNELRRELGLGEYELTTLDIDGLKQRLESDLLHLKDLVKQCKPKRLKLLTTYTLEEEKSSHLADQLQDENIKMKKIENKVSRLEEELKCTKSEVSCEEAELQAACDEIHDKILKTRKFYGSNSNDKQIVVELEQL